MAYSSIIKPSTLMNTKTYTGNQSSTNALTGVGFKPDLTWIKIRNGTGSHYLYDAIRGVTKSISSDTSSAELTNSYFSSFNTDGFTLGSASNNVNGAYNYAAWNWKAGTSFTNDASSTGIGSIDSSGSFNNDAGFSIVSYTGNSPTATTIKHGLNSIPQMIIFKRLVGVGNMTAYHQSLGNTKAIFLTTTAASDTSAGYFNNTTPTSSVFSVANSGDTNSNGNAMIAYCFAEKQGYSKFGTYTGNNSTNGTFVYTGFKPAWVMVFAYTAGNENWMLVDNKRDGYNVENEQLFPNTNDDEESNNEVDLVSNGFKLRRANTRMNGAIPYIYAAFAEEPFVASNYNVATAR